MIVLLLVAAAVTFPVTPRTAITIEAGAADVRITGSTRVDVEVRVERASASVEGDRIIIRSDDAGGIPNREARARVEVEVPEGLAIDTIRIVDGQLTLRGLRGRVAADVRQGGIRATDLSGVVRLETGFGDVVLEGARLVDKGLLRLRAFNGNVRLSLADYPENARILALSFNGHIESTLPLVRRESFGPRFAEATLGAGERVISLDSVTGDITITAAASPRR
jgi:hypothetical protein